MDRPALRTMALIFFIMTGNATPAVTERGGGEDARATVSDQQVNPMTPRYPVDRYLVERSNKLEMVNIIDDDIWNTEPALRPEDEIVLRKLHDVLQSTADDLKLLSGELSKHHEPGVRVKSIPTPLDEEFNEKVHIEQLVDAKFHGYNVVDETRPTPANAQKGKVDRLIKFIPSNIHTPRKVINAGIQVNQVPIFEKPVKKNNLTVSCTKIIQINESMNNAINSNEKNNRHQKEKTSKPIVGYKELSFKYTEPNNKRPTLKLLHVQNMPSINIRSELRKQEVLQINIEPKATSNDHNDVSRNNIAVVSVQHEPIAVPKRVPITNINQVQHPVVPTTNCGKEPIRKFSKMSSCESSEMDSRNRAHSFTHGFRKIRRRLTKTAIKPPPRLYLENVKNKSNINSKKESVQHSTSNLDIWKKKLNAVYGCPTTSRKSKTIKPENKAKKFETKSNLTSCSQLLRNRNTLNNAEYIPYSKLTLGGARVSDIEKELSGISNKHDITLGPILNKILSRENSFHNESPLINLNGKNPKVLTTSDENLLQEVLDIERKVTKTLRKDVTEPNVSFDKEQPLNDVDDPISYADDFDDEKTDYSAHSDKQQLSDNTHSDDMNLPFSRDNDNDDMSFKIDDRKDNIKNKTYIKTQNLSLKNNVDVFEFIHNIDTQETGTQSNTTHKSSLKETQTSPRNDKYNVQPIHNDLWPSIDPKGEVEKLFQIEKDFIKKVIVDEYGDVFEKNLNKPSTSKDSQNIDEKNVTASQKNTQTSPTHVKSVMTSPTRTKTRTTSPFALSLTIDQQTSPIKEEVKLTVEDGVDLGLSINLSSPRFSLRLPQTTCEVVSHFESYAQSNRNTNKNGLTQRRLAENYGISSSSSAEGDYSSSDNSSLGEIRFKLKRLQKLQVSTASDSTSVSKCSSNISDAIIPLRSEGEISLGQVYRKKSNKNTKSEGEASVECL